MNEAVVYYQNLISNLQALKSQITNMVSNPQENAYLQQAINTVCSLCNQQIVEIQNNEP